MIDIKAWIKKHEGLRLHPYKDAVDKLTIGYGRNLDDHGISSQEADFLFDNDLDCCKKELSQYSWYLSAPLHVQYALLNMCFNMGISRLLTFTKMIFALISKDYTKASIEALNSQWAEQVGQRAKDVALMMREGL